MLIHETPDVTGADRKFYSRPIQASNPAARFNATKVESSKIERRGYVKGDQLLVRLEVPS